MLMRMRMRMLRWRWADGGGWGKGWGTTDAVGRQPAEVEEVVKDVFITVVLSQ